MKANSCKQSLEYLWNWSEYEYMNLLNKPISTMHLFHIFLNIIIIMESENIHSENASTNSMNVSKPDNMEKIVMSCIPGAATATTTVIVVTAQAVSTFGAVSSISGFIPQIAAGSMAARIMSVAATTGYGGAIVSAMQSAGALFVNAVGTSTLAATGAVIAPVVAGVVAYKTYNWYYGEGGEDEDEKLEKQLEILNKKPFSEANNPKRLGY